MSVTEEGLGYRYYYPEEMNMLPNIAVGTRVFYFRLYEH